MNKTDCYKCNIEPSVECGECAVWLADEEVSEKERIAYQQGMADAVEDLENLLRCRNYRGCVAIKGCDGICRINSDICKSCENFGIPYSLLEQRQKGQGQ